MRIEALPWPLQEWRRLAAAVELAAEMDHLLRKRRVDAQHGGVVANVERLRDREGSVLEQRVERLGRIATRQPLVEADTWPTERRSRVSEAKWLTSEAAFTQWRGHRFR